MKHVKCLICDEEFETNRKLTSHITSIHKINPKEYYDKYMLSDTAEKTCSLCEKFTKFLGRTRGYATMCETCIAMGSQKRYDKFVLKKESDKYCIVCSAPTKFLTYYEGYNTFCSDKCRTSKAGNLYLSNKRKKTCLDKYGVDHQMKSKLTKDKISKTNLERYGCVNVFENTDIKIKAKESMVSKYGVAHARQNVIISDKIKTNMLEKYGVDNYTKTDEYKQQVKVTNLKKYGVESYSQTDEFKEKLKATNISRYGVISYFQTDECKNKSKITNIAKYGVDNFSKTDECKHRIKATNIEKYGVECYMQTEEFIKQTTQTCLEKYGVPFVTQNKDIRHKITSTLRTDRWKLYQQQLLDKQLKPLHDEYFYVNNYTSEFTYECLKCGNILKSSKPAVYKIFCPNHKSIEEDKLCELIKSFGFEVETNKRFDIGYKGNREIDIYIPKLKIGIEYNGAYWHSTEYKSKDYHLDKKLRFKKYHDIDIVHIYPNNLSNMELFYDFIKSLLNKSKIIKPILTEITNDEYIDIYLSMDISGALVNKYDKYFKIESDERIDCVFGIDSGSVVGVVYKNMNPYLVNFIMENTNTYKFILNYDMYLSSLFILPDKTVIIENTDPDIIYYNSSGSKVLTDIDAFNEHKNNVKLYNSGKVILKYKS